MDVSIEEIVELSYKHYNNLPKTGKPNSSEWTVLSTIIKQNRNSNNLEVVALGTGSKCIGQCQASLVGDVLNDSHAEVICRRAFLRYLLQELHESLTDRSEIFTFDSKNGVSVLKDNIVFHLFSTQVPCGDASIFPISVENEQYSVPSLKRAKIEVNVTGAKCLSQVQVEKLTLRYVNSEKTGEVRTKPGRGSPTLSVSCSDKIAKWCHLGVQGSIISLLLKNPLYFKSFTIASKDFDKFAIARALFTRFDSKVENYFANVKRVDLFCSKNCLDPFKRKGKQACSSSIVWCKTKDKSFEVAIEGRRQGTTKNKLATKSARLKICKMEIYRSFATVVHNSPFKISKMFQIDQTYFTVKKNAMNYQEKWKFLKEDGFKSWPKKTDSKENFILD